MRAFVTGTSIPLSDVHDEVFSTGVMGEGMAIEPKDELIVSPIDGRI
ncbi:PTS glucose transporter subunit IIA, partial [Enterococcus raffinosus]